MSQRSFVETAAPAGIALLVSSLVVPSGPAHAQEGADGDRLDFATQAVEGEAVDAGQEAAVADALDGGIAEVSREDEAADLKLRQATGDIFGSQAAASGKFVGSGWAADLCVTAQQQAAGFFAVGHLDGHARGEPQVGHGVSTEESAHDVHVFGSKPEGSSVDLAPSGTAVVLQFVEPTVPVRDRRGVDGDEAEEGVVDFLGVAGLGPGFFDHALDGGGVKASEVAGAFGEGAAGGDGA